MIKMEKNQIYYQMVTYLKAQNVLFKKTIFIIVDKYIYI